MNRFISGVPFLAVLTVVCGCPPSPIPPPNPPDSGDASPPVGDAPFVPPCQAACNTLAALGCPEAAPGKPCLDTLSNSVEGKNIPTPCGSALCPPMSCSAIARVTTKAQAKAQGVGCGQ
jgi:hypothetical protein